MPAICPPSNPPHPRAALATTRPRHLFLRLQNPPAVLSNTTLAATRPGHLFVRAGKRAACFPHTLATRSYTYSKGNTSPWFIFFHALSVLERAISFPGLVSQRALFDTPGTSGHGSASFRWKALLHIKLVAADASTVHLPCFGVT